ncbi:MAG: hypothetical protein GXO86_06790 [Chlorobi bacterium]|nr:hypothetical protein [Chlorobiota bacterium]
MKRIFLIIQLLILGTVISLGQISLEITYKADMKAFQLEDGTFKFIKVDLENKKLLVYNADNILENSIAIQVPTGHKLKDVKLISSHAEGEKDNFSVLYTCYYEAQKSGNDFADRFPDQLYTLNVIDPDGNYLLKIPYTTSYKLLPSTDDNNKLLVYQTMQKGFETQRIVEVYGF